ncbi:MAG: hypothetical protein NZV14_03345 [Bryobacteraceae bacterium]|nr:hypothetical protein [Bryobacteraceae bacterium]MDW8377171.1 hypothetical protein [Bryobacterales bacterium]
MLAVNAAAKGGVLRFFLIYFLAASIVLSQEQSPPAARPGIFGEIDELLRELEKITGLKSLRKVPSDTISKENLKKFLEERIQEAVKPEEIRAEQIALQMLGFVPAEFDLKKMTIDLLTEQAAAFYDYKKKRLFLLDSNASSLQRPILVHELAHALADQHFDLEKYLLKGKSDDAALARMAVMEGQATWLMSEYVLSQLGASLKRTPEMAEWMNRLSGSSGGLYPVFDSAPLYLRETLMFPYTKGVLFQNAVIAKMGDAGFAEVFRNPPASSQQILHPQKYFDRERPVSVEPPQVKLRGYTRLIEGTFGELDHEILFRQYGDEATPPLAERWRGGVYRILENKKQNHRILLYASEWIDTRAAAAAFLTWRKAMQKKWRRFEVSTESSTELSGRCDWGIFRLQLFDRRVTSVEGLPERPRRN